MLVTCKAPQLGNHCFKDARVNASCPNNPSQDCLLLQGRAVEGRHLRVAEATTAAAWLRGVDLVGIRLGDRHVHVLGRRGMCLPCKASALVQGG